MKLSDVVSASGLAWYPMVALILFFVVFVAVIARLVFAKRETLVHMAMLPLEGDVSSPFITEDPTHV